MPTVQIGVRTPRTFTRPRLHAWSINLVEDHLPELTGQARADAEREARISAFDKLICADCATPLWQRVCCFEMTREIRSRSPGQRLAMELVLAESVRRPS